MAETHLTKLLELDAQTGTGCEKVETLLLGLKEENYPNAGDNRSLVKPMQYYSTCQSLDDVQLPMPLPPRIDPKRNKAKIDKLVAETNRPMTDIGHSVAEIAWERRTRLDRPGSLPRVQERCPCQYCFNPSPYQTYAYKLVEQRLRSSGEWDRMKQPLRMDDPRVCEVAQAAQQTYYTPSDLPSSEHESNNNDNDNTNNVSDTKNKNRNNRHDDYNHSKFTEEIENPNNNNMSNFDIETTQESASNRMGNGKRPQDISDVAVPAPNDAGCCCSCVIL
jgi:hypothetical protein